MKSTLFIILITFQQLTYSQEVTIKDEKTILSKEKTIDLAKIVTNEKALQKRVEILEAYLVDLNDSIQKTISKHAESLKTINNLSKVVKNQHEELNELTEKDLTLEKKKNNLGVYSFLNIGSTKNAFRSIDIGLILVRSKVIYTLAIDPITLPEPILKIGIGMKLF